ncbi:MAG: hypothetical protein KA956_15140, partial [Pyrinomonadaceae bacterium]|nr:hypothetical protein [Pyrinomonadaceae bacterium]
MKGKVITSWSLILLLASVLLIAGGALNLSQRAYQKLPPTDGVQWTHNADGIFAERILKGFAGDRAGISPGDKLIAISIDNQTPDEVVSVSDVQIYLETAGVNGSLTYTFQKSYSFADNYYFADLRNIDSVPRWTPSIIFLAMVGLVWLGVGMFVLFKQGSQSPFVLHFAAVCLAAFTFHTYKPVGIGQDFDLAVSLLDDFAFALFVPLFLHFCIRYPVRSTVFDEQRWKTILLYVPAAVVSVWLLFISLLPALFWRTDAAAWLARVDDRYNLTGGTSTFLLYHFVIGVSVGAGFLIWRFWKNHQIVVRQRLKWAMWGTIAAVFPVIIMQTASWFGVQIADNTVATALTTLPLALIPFSFGHSVVRYRLMDVDVVVRRALVYALTTVAIA